MEEILVNERVSTLIGYYDDNRVRIIRIRWKSMDYKVEKQTAQWLSREGREVVEHFTTKTGEGSILWLQHYRLKDEWWLERICLT